MRCALNIVKHNNLGNQAQMKYVCSFIVIFQEFFCAFIIIIIVVKSTAKKPYIDYSWFSWMSPVSPI
jgi:hypothetical protein